MKIAEELQQEYEATFQTGNTTLVQGGQRKQTYGLLDLFKNSDCNQLSGFQNTVKQLKRLRKCQAVISRRLMQPIDPKR